MSFLKEEALDIKLLEQILRPASYADIPFGVVSYEVQSGRDIDVTTLYKGASTTMADAGGVRALAVARGFTPGEGEAIASARGRRAQALVELEKAKKSKVYGLRDIATEDHWDNVANSMLMKPGEHPLVTDKGALPNKITLRAYFIDRSEFYDKIVGDPQEQNPYKTKIEESGRGRLSYIINRDKFLKAVNNQNPNMLQLPTYGKFPAVSGAVNMEFKSDIVGIEYVDVEFYRATSDVVIPKTEGEKFLIQEGWAELQEKTTTDIANLKETALTEKFNPNGTLPTSVQWAMEASVQERLDSFGDGSTSLASSIVHDIEGKLDTIDKYTREVVAISNQISTLILAPVQLAQHIQNTYKTLMGAITNPIESFDFMLSKVDLFADQMSDITYDTLDTLGLYNASEDIMHMGYGFSAVAEAVVEIPYDSVEQVIEARDNITSSYSSVISIIARFPEFEDVLGSLQGLYGNTISYLIDKQAHLPNARSITTIKNLPLIVTAYTVYGDAGGVEDLALRNKVKSRLFPPVELEVLSL